MHPRSRLHAGMSLILVVGALLIMTQGLGLGSLLSLLPIPESITQGTARAGLGAKCSSRTILRRQLDTVGALMLRGRRPVLRVTTVQAMLVIMCLPIPRFEPKGLCVPWARLHTAQNAMSVTAASRRRSPMPTFAILLDAGQQMLLLLTLTPVQRAHQTKTGGRSQLKGTSVALRGKTSTTIARCLQRQAMTLAPQEGR